MIGNVSDRQPRGNHAKPVLKAASSRKSAWREGSRSRPSCGPGGFWSGSRPSRTSKVRRCATSFANLSPFSQRRSDPWVGISKPAESRIKKFIGGRSASTGALPIERPAKHELRRTIMVSGHSPEPVINQARFSDSGPGNDCNDVYVLVSPCTIQKSDILLSTKNIASGNGQSGYGNLLRSQSSSAACEFRHANRQRASSAGSDE